MTSFILAKVNKAGQVVHILWRPIHVLRRNTNLHDVPGVQKLVYLLSVFV